MSRVPTRIGKYSIENKVAEGGMGAVYKGLHPTLNRQVILKKLTLKGSIQFIERFRREAEIMMEFKQDNIVSVYDHFKAGDSYYIVLEFIDGPSLGDLVKKERYLPEDVALYIIRECAVALAYAHKRLVVHRDIKPANILLSKEGDVKLVDFGVAHRGDDEDSELTTDGMTIGTPSYMAPEQFKDSKSVTNRADIYSLGVMLYEMLTGKKPYPGNFSPEAIAKIQKGKYQRPRKHNPAITSKAEGIIKKCMKANPLKRYSQSDDLVQQLNRYFKKQDEKQTLNRLRALIAGEPVKVEKKSFTLRKALLLIILPLAIAAAGWVSWKLGLVHEYLLTKNYGRVNLVLTAPGDVKRAPQVFRMVQFFQDDDHNIPAIEKGVLFYPARRTEEGHWQFRSLPVYLPQGHYRLKVQLEEELLWENLYLPNRDAQRLDGSSEKGQTISMDITGAPGRPLDFGYSMIDHYSGNDLTGAGTIEVERNGAWQRAENFQWESGQVYKIRFQAANYYPKVYHVRIHAFQDSFQLQASLIPLPGRLELQLPEVPVEVLINGEPNYRSGENLGGIEPLDRIQGSQSLVLSPGIYSMVFKFRKSEISRDVRIEQGQTLTVTVDYNDESREILFP